MKLNFRIPGDLKQKVRHEMSVSKDFIIEGKIDLAWRHLERAHILAQSYPLEHTYVHWEMVRFAMKNGDIKEVLGQIPRLIFGGPKSLINNVPLGNTGRANVPPLRKMETTHDLKEILNRYQ